MQNKQREVKVYDNILECIGDTPMVRLNRIPKDYGLSCQIYAKCEFINPGGSIKDRIAYTMILDGEKKGIVTSNTRLIEPTSGNTGIGVSLACAVRGYDCTIVTPDKNSDEKMSTMSLLGSEIVQTPSMVRYDDPDSFMSVTEQLLKEYPNGVSLDQYSNDVNPETHYSDTADEIIRAMGTVDMFVMGSGTGGTVTGVAKRLKKHNPNCVIVTVDPKGSIIFGVGKPVPFFYSNDVNPETHYSDTADEIIRAMATVDMFVMGSGTGGTVTGVANDLKSIILTA